MLPQDVVVVLKAENTISGWSSSRKLVAPKQDNIQLTAQPLLETVCAEIVNMVLGSVEVHDGGLLYFYFLDGTELEIETEE